MSLTPFKAYYLGYSTSGSHLSFNLTGTDTQGRPWTGFFNLSSNGPTVFESQNVTKASTSFTRQQGTNTPLTVSTQMYFQNMTSNRTLYKITRETISVPGTVSWAPPTFFGMPSDPSNVGASGPIATLGGIDGSVLNIAWELRPEFFGNSHLTITSTIRDIFNVLTYTEADTYYLDKKGNPYKLGVAVITGGVTVTMTGDRL